MKTEKRLTMALSVLVALMMLAVPLASSSNLFVDGGQTNSNGDAPNLGAASYRVDFILNEGSEGRISLDEVTGNGIANLPVLNGVTWFEGENGNIFAVVDSSKNVTIQILIDALYDSGSSRITKAGYALTAYMNENGNSYDNLSQAAIPILSDMTFTAQWALQENYVEVPVTVNFGDETFEYVKTYEVTDGNITVDFSNGNDSLQKDIEAAGGFDVNGYVLNANDGSSKSRPVYSNGVVTYDNGRTLPSGGVIPSASTLTVTYTFNENEYTEIIIHSDAFIDGEDVILYVDDDIPYTYDDIFVALNVNATSIFSGEAALVNNETSDGKYLITGWNNGAVNLKSEYQTTATEFTLDASLNGYSVVFMINGQYEVVFVNFGELTANATTLNISGVNHWAWIPFSGEDSLASITGDVVANDNLFNILNFDAPSSVAAIETLAAADSYTDPDAPVAAIVACFESPANTAYAVFDAVTGYFGDNELIKKIVVSGKADTSTTSESNAASVVMPSVNPVFGANTVFTGYTNYIVGNEVAKYDGLNTTKYFSASSKSYNYTITFQDGENVVGILYMDAVTTSLTIDSLYGAKALQYNGNVYSSKEDIKNYLNQLLNPNRDGYKISQWNNADGDEMILISAAADSSITTSTTNFTSLTSDIILYSQFNAKPYTIEYVNTLGGVGATQTDGVVVDKEITLLGENSLLNENYTLIGWSTVPGAGGNEYKLGGTFVLSGADYEKLADSAGDNVVVKLYSVWQANGSNVPGDNNEGSGDNTALYLIAGMLAVIAILAIVGILLMRKK